MVGQKPTAAVAGQSLSQINATKHKKYHQNSSNNSGDTNWTDLLQFVT